LFEKVLQFPGFRVMYAYHQFIPGVYLTSFQVAFFSF